LKINIPQNTKLALRIKFYNYDKLLNFQIDEHIDNYLKNTTIFLYRRNDKVIINSYIQNECVGVSIPIMTSNLTIYAFFMKLKNIILIMKIIIYLMRNRIVHINLPIFNLQNKYISCMIFSLP